MSDHDHGDGGERKLSPETFTAQALGRVDAVEKAHFRPFGVVTGGFRRSDGKLAVSLVRGQCQAVATDTAFEA